MKRFIKKILERIFIKHNDYGYDTVAVFNCANTKWAESDHGTWDYNCGLVHVKCRIFTSAYNKTARASLLLNLEGTNSREFLTLTEGHFSAESYEELKQDIERWTRDNIAKTALVITRGFGVDYATVMKNVEYVLDKTRQYD